MDNTNNDLEFLTEDNFLGLCDVMTDIYEDLQMTGCDKVFIQKTKLNHNIRFSQLRPTTLMPDLDNYADCRIRAVQYLNKEGIIEKYMIAREMLKWEKNIVITVNEEKFRDLYRKVLDFYHQNHKNKKTIDEPQFRFDKGVLFRDGNTTVLKFNENDLEYNLLIVSFDIPFGERIDLVSSGDALEQLKEPEFRDWKQLYDTARRLNTKIEKEFKIKNFLTIYTEDKFLVRNVL